eukprot:gnl/Hemi2/9866_TR3439_c0_g1_i1.p1 gnl/Hemi2/9866_TR3439_c0_g1~~gnl/Hemi2/9866_TR3439_c0_g1_i1.p1  ORF type:complete len:276 (-),score=68.89 gnl/Hemi2/9866_TR3439_c0_g1_i1:38-865(-)
MTPIFDISEALAAEGGVGFASASVVGFAAAWLGLFGLVVLWSEQLAGRAAWLQLSANDQLVWRVRFVSGLHAVFAASVGLYCIFVWEYPEGANLCDFSPRWQQMALFVSVGYFVYDTGMELVKMVIGEGDWAIFIHHLVSILSLGLSGLLRYSSWFSLGILVTEISTITLHARWHLIVTNQKAGRAYLAVSLLFVALFFFFRVLFLPPLAWRAYQHDFCPTNPSVVSGIFKFDWFFIIGINYFWFYKVATMALSQLKKKQPEPSCSPKQSDKKGQ